MAKSLNAKSVAAARHPGGHKRPVRLPDGGGLYLQVAAGGTKSWLFRYMLAGRERMMGLGPAESVSLADARQAATAARAVLHQGLDPLEHRNARQAAADTAAAAAAANTFRTVTDAFLAAHGGKWRNAKHRAQWASTISSYAYPTMQDLPVASINTAHVRAVLEPIWQSKHETASRLRGRIEAVLDYASATGMRDEGSSNPARWRGHLSSVLGNVRKARTVRHHPALKWEAMQPFMVALRAKDGTSARALEFAILTAARSGETMGATWREIDLEAGIWTIPESRMKAHREHRVALSQPAVTLLTTLKPLAIDDASHLFPGRVRGKGLSVMALDMLLRRMNTPAAKWVDRNGEAITAHGFRSTFRDWVGEATQHQRETAEAALAHIIGGVEGAYARGDLLTKRKSLMDDWAAYCCYKAHVAEQETTVKAA